MDHSIAKSILYVTLPDDCVQISDDIVHNAGSVKHVQLEKTIDSKASAFS